MQRKEKNTQKVDSRIKGWGVGHIQNKNVELMYDAHRSCKTKK